MSNQITDDRITLKCTWKCGDIYLETPQDLSLQGWNRLSAVVGLLRPEVSTVTGTTIPTNLAGTPQSWPLPPHLRVPRHVADAPSPVRSTGTDATGNYYEDFYPPGSDQRVYRDDQGYFQIDDGAVHVSYLNLPGASIEHRLVPRPSSGASLENAP